MNLAGMPLVELVAKRATTYFSETWVATSIDPSDDLLAKHLNEANIPCYRGSLNNVLDRFFNLCKQQNIGPDDVVIRLTGDNPIVDEFFLLKMREVWEKNNLCYLSGEPANLEKFGWPKGLSAEFFKAKDLYEVSNSSNDNYSMEHVTPNIKKKALKSASMADYLELNNKYLNSYGIDTLKDYLFLANLFYGKNWDIPYFKILQESE